MIRLNSQHTKRQTHKQCQPHWPLHKHWINPPWIKSFWLSGLFVLSGCHLTTKPVIPNTGPTMAAIYQQHQVREHTATSMVQANTIKVASHPVYPKQVPMAVLAHSVQLGKETIQIPTYGISFPLKIEK